MAKYKDKFFRDRHARTLYAAETILGIVLPALPPVVSAIDIGCGVGTWLSVLAKRGTAHVQGVDGPWVDTANLKIPRGSFVHHDLVRDRDFGQRFDLAISLEVAEHLPPARATGFVAWLAALSDFVLFSAATPRQGGRNHFNEQWQDYWAALFAERGYAPVDLVRPRIWKDPMIATWYRQNVLLYIRQSRSSEFRGQPESAPLAIVHPDVFTVKLDRAATIGGVLKRWRRALRGKR